MNDTSVRDHRQKAELKGDLIVVTSYVGRQKAHSYSFSTKEWQDTLKKPNPFWHQRELIRSKTLEMDDQDGWLACQADRIRDSQCYAIEKLFI